MKTLKLIIAAFCLTVAVNVAKADGNPANALSKEYAIRTYTDAVSHGKIAGLDNVFDDHATFSLIKGNKLVSNNKADMLSFFKENQNVTQDCTVDTSIVSSNEDMSIVKVEMHYTNFTRTNYVTVVNTGNGWKITNVHSVFES